MALQIKGKTGLVLGAARSGIAVARTIIDLGGKVMVSEFKPREAVARELEELASLNAAIEVGGHTREFILKSDYIVLSPGVRMDIPPVKWAKEAGIEVMGEIEFAYRLCPCPIIAVTGSNGKTTTVTLIARVLQKAGKNAVLCGNIGSPFSKHVLSLKASDIVVLEISSFQLESTTTFKPKVAVWLNFSQNHLDRHKDLEEYFQAKKKIFAQQDTGDTAVLNAGQTEFQAMASTLKSRVVFFDRNDPQDAGLNANQMAVIASVGAMGVPRAVCLQVFASFKGVEHRLEFVRNLGGVDYINDSKSTTPEAGRWAMSYLTKPLVMICGGSDKHADFSGLRDLARAKVRKMIVIGTTKEQLRRTFADVVPLSVCGTLPEAVALARSDARAGDIVVLSPMCASFDMFKDYEHRGQVFKEIVSQLI